MKITQDKATFRPVTIRLETQDDFDKFDAIVHHVANNVLNIPVRVVHAAREFNALLQQISEEE